MRKKPLKIGFQGYILCLSSCYLVSKSSCIFKVYQVVKSKLLSSCIYFVCRMLCYVLFLYVAPLPFLSCRVFISHSLSNAEGVPIHSRLTEVGVLPHNRQPCDTSQDTLKKASSFNGL